MTTIKVAHSYKIYEPMSMLPTNGWRAVFAYDDGSDERDGKRLAHAETMVVFVLTRIHYTDVYENGYEATTEEIRIMGYVAGDIDIQPAEEAGNFMGYLAPGTRIPSHVEQRAKEYVLAHETETVGTPNEETTNGSP